MIARAKKYTVSYIWVLIIYLFLYCSQKSISHIYILAASHYFVVFEEVHLERSPGQTITSRNNSYLSTKP